MQMNLIPGLNAKSRVQPWALGSNAFGVESGTEAIMGGLISQRLCRNINKAAHSVKCVPQSAQRGWFHEVPRMGAAPLNYGALSQSPGLAALFAAYPGIRRNSSVYPGKVESRFNLRGGDSNKSHSQG